MDGFLKGSAWIGLSSNRSPRTRTPSFDGCVQTTPKDGHSERDGSPQQGGDTPVYEELLPVEELAREEDKSSTIWECFPF